MTITKSQHARFYAMIDGEQKGPFSLDELTQMHRDRIINLETLSWQEGTDTWVALKQVLPPLNPPPLPSSHAAAPPPEPSYRLDHLGFTVVGLCFAHTLLIWAGVLFGVDGSGFWALEWLIPMTWVVLIYFDAKLLGMGTDQDRTQKGRRRTKPFMWTILGAFPLTPFYLYRRRLYGARNLVIPGLMAIGSSLVGTALVLVGGFATLLDGPPEVDSPEVLALVKEVVDRKLSPDRCVAVVSPVEVRYEPDQQRRIGRAAAQMPSGETIPFVFSVKWHNPETREFIVSAADRESELE